MAITYTYTLLRTQRFGSETVLDWNISATGTYTTNGDSFTAAKLGLDKIDFISISLDGSSSANNGVALVAPDLTNFKWKLFGDGGSSGAAFVEIGSSTTMTGLQFFARVYGVC